MAKCIEERPHSQAQRTVPLIDLKSEHQRLGAELRDIWSALLESTAFVGGPAVGQFERAFADYCDVRHAIGVANGTDALVLALRALGVGRNDEVITAANSFVATAEAIVQCGATPVFIDVDPRSYNIDVNQIEKRITRRTKVLIPVHLYGRPAEMAAVLEIARRHGLRVVEDAAQAHGARFEGRRAGSIGDIACFSFYPAKNLGACGDGGAVTTNDDELAATVRRLRDHGGLKKYEHDLVGTNSRLDSLQAAALQIKLPYLDERNNSRRRHAATYRELLSAAPGVVVPQVSAGTESVYHLYVIRVERGNRDALQRFALERGVHTGVHYPVPIHRTRAFAAFNASECPVAEKYAGTILSLPMYPEMERQDVEYVAGVILDYLEACE